MQISTFLISMVSANVVNMRVRASVACRYRLQGIVGLYVTAVSMLPLVAKPIRQPRKRPTLQASIDLPAHRHTASQVPPNVTVHHPYTFVVGLKPDNSITSLWDEDNVLLDSIYQGV